MGYPNDQGNPAAAIPVWIAGGGSGSPAPGQSVLLYEQISGLNTAKGLNAPVGTKLAVITPQDANVRWRADGTDPTASVGMPLYSTSYLNWTSNFSAIKFIALSGTPILNVVYYG